MSVSITIDASSSKEGATPQDPITSEAAARWKRDSSLRAEFCENFDTYAAFERAAAGGRIRILGQPQPGGRK